jgi:hypothetical protein
MHRITTIIIIIIIIIIISCEKLSIKFDLD